MAQKSKKKHKKKARLVAPAPLAPLQPRNIAANLSPGRRWESISRILTILGIALTALGLVALIELSPRLSVSPNSPLSYTPHDFAGSFTVSNDGYLRVVDPIAGCFLWHVQTLNSTEQNQLVSFEQPPTHTLLPTEGFTITCSDVSRIDQQPRFIKIDLAIVVYYRPWPWPFTINRSRKVFRFSGRPGADLNSTIWDKQPAADLENDLDSTLKRFPMFPFFDRN